MLQVDQTLKFLDQQEATSYVASPWADKDCQVCVGDQPDEAPSRAESVPF